MVFDAPFVSFGVAGLLGCKIQENNTQLISKLKLQEERILVIFYSCFYGSSINHIHTNTIFTDKNTNLTMKL
jgi:hypothetical protein